MRRCIQLAKNGLGTTYPNPLVGSVVVYEDQIIGEGWHDKAGRPHAEVNAIADVKDSSLLKKATIYVNLEPCSHFGKTPPCANLIISHEIKTVVIGILDPNPEVAGKGVQKLLEAGCEVVVGQLEEECDELNKRFFTFQKKKRPYIFLKWAQTLDGFMAPEKREKREPVWITNKLSRQRTHQLRAQEQAILVGTTTVLKDNPSLSTRDWQGASPTRIVIDKVLKIPENSNVYDRSIPTIIITENQKENQDNIMYECIDFSKNIPQQISQLVAKHSLQSLIVEGGTKTLQTFIDLELWDEALVFTGDIVFGNGTKAPVFHGRFISEEKIGNDLFQQFKNPQS